MHFKGLRRRKFLLGALATGMLGGCAWRNRNAPVILGGAAVARDAPIMAAIAQSSAHRVLADALRQTGLDEVLEGPGPLTLFAPTDAAFEALTGEIGGLGEDAAFLESVLRGHIVQARVTSEELTAALPRIGGLTKLLPLNDHSVTIEGEAEALSLMDMRERKAQFVTRDGEAANGFIHAIDKVLLPPTPEESS